MADSNYRQFLASDIHGAFLAAGGFSQFVDRILIPALNESQETIKIGGNTYPIGAAVHNFSLFLLSSEKDGFRSRYLPNLNNVEPAVIQELVGELRALQPYLKIDPEDSGTRALTISHLQKAVEIYGKYAAMGQQGGGQDNTAAITEAVQSLSASLKETTGQVEKILEFIKEPHLKEDDKKLEEIPEEDQDKPEDKDNIPVLTAKKERREKHSKTIADFRKKTTEAVKTQKEQRRIDGSSLAGKIYSAIEKEENKNEEIAKIVIKILGPLAKSAQQSDPNQTYLWAQRQLKEALEILNSFIESLRREFEKIQTASAQELLALIPTAATALPNQDAGGAKAEEPKDEEPEDEKPADINNEQNRKARAAIRDKWLAEIEKTVNALNPPRVADLYLALGLGREIDSPETQAKSVTAYIAIARNDVTELHDEYSTAAENLAAGKEIDEALNPPTATNYNQHIERVLQAKLLAAWKTVLEEETPESKPSNVPVGAIADAQKQQAAQAAGAVAAQPESEASLSDKIAKISRVQHDMLLVAEGELRLKLRTLGLQEPQIEKIINDNRTLLLDTIRYKAFALAGDLPADKRAGSSQIVAAVSNEVESFYQKLIVTYSDTNAQPQLAGYFAKADKTTVTNITNGLKALGWSENDIYDVISNLENSKFAPLLEYAKANGYLSGAAGLANVLVKNNIVTRDGADAMALRLQNGDIGSIIEPMLNQLPADEKKRVMRDLLRILEKSQKGGTLSADEKALFNKHIRDLLPSQTADAFLSIVSRLTIADLHSQMSQLYGVLAAADAGADLKGRPSLSSPLVAFAGGSSTTASTAAVESEGMSDRDKFMLEVSLAEAYRRVAEAENRGDSTELIEVEIALIAHQFTKTGSAKGGLTAKFYSDIDGNGGGLDDVAQNAGINTDQLANARKNSYKNRVANQQGGGAQDKMAQAQLAAKLLRTGGNPAAIAATLLTDAQARKLIIERLKAIAVPGAIVGGGVVAAPMIVAAAVLNALSQIPIIGGLVSSLGSLLGLGAVGGTSAGGTAGAQGIAGAFKNEAINSAKNLNTYGKKEFARSKPGLSEAARNTVSGATQNATQMVYNINSSMAPGWLAGAAILGPLAMASFFTIIVITVIGGSLGGMPTDNPFFAEQRGSIGTENLGLEACWPAEGRITTMVHPANAGRLSGGETAMDFAMNVGTKVYTPFGGTAKFLRGNQSDPNKVCTMVKKGVKVNIICGYGVYVRVTTDKGFDVIFGHLSAYAGGKYGESIPVVAGQQIGFSGDTGQSSGPHLHYGVLPVNGVGRAPAIYSVIPPVFPATSLSPATIQSFLDNKTGPYFSAKFASCKGGKPGGQPGSFTPPDLAAPNEKKSSTGNSTTEGTNVGKTITPPATAPTQSQINDILTKPVGGN